jgi:DNA-binding CsgD family transcriptional regulator
VLVQLDPLPAPAVAELIADQLAARPSADLLDLAAAGSGNPAAIVDLVQGLIEDGLVATGSGTASLIQARLPERTRRRLRQALEQMSPAARHLVQVASGQDGPFRLCDLDGLGPPAGLLPAAEEVLTSGLLVFEHEHLAFGHDLVRAVVAESVPAWGRDAVLDDGGRRATAYRPSVLTMIDTLVGAGRLAAATDLARDALSHPQPVTLGAGLRGRLAQALFLAGRADEAAAAVAPVLIGVGIPDGLRDEARALTIVASAVHDPERARREAEAALAADPRGPGLARVAAAAVRSSAARGTGDLVGALRLAQEAVARLDATTSTTSTPTTTTTTLLRVHANLTLGRMIADADGPAAAEAVVAQVIAETERLGLEPHRAWAVAARADLLLRLGRLAEARAAADTAARTAERVGAAHVAVMGMAVLARIAVRQGGPIVDLPAGGTAEDWFAVLAVAAQDGPRAAAALLRGSHHELVHCPDLHLREPGAAAWLVRLARAVDDDALRRAAVRAARDLAARNPGLRGPRMAALHAGGLADSDAGMLARAARGHADPWAAACAAEDAGLSVAQRLGPADGAVAHLETALRQFVAIGADGDAARVVRHLRALGSPHRPDPRWAVRGEGWESLTDRERAIAHLTGQAMTNRQIAARVQLSHHTVNYHLRRIYRKLSIRSRVELARALAQARSDAPPST